MEIRKDKDPLGTRIKENYENRTRYYIPRRTYTIIRLDGCHFKTYTRGLNKPFDRELSEDIDNAITTTKRFIPCGGLQEFDVIINAVPFPEEKNFAVNLIGHGSIIFADSVKSLKKFKYVPRSLPERMNGQHLCNT
jgi:tRNA(His) 5'-end guanylyltransferase